MAAPRGHGQQRSGQARHGVFMVAHVVGHADRIVLGVEHQQRHADPLHQRHRVAALQVSLPTVVASALVQVLVKFIQALRILQPRQAWPGRQSLAVARHELAYQPSRHHPAIGCSRAGERHLDVVTGAIGEGAVQRGVIALLAEVAHQQAGTRGNTGGVKRGVGVAFTDPSQLLAQVFSVAQGVEARAGQRQLAVAETLTQHDSPAGEALHVPHEHTHALWCTGDGVQHCQGRRMGWQVGAQPVQCRGSSVAHAQRLDPVVGQARGERFLDTGDENLQVPVDGPRRGPEAPR